MLLRIYVHSECFLSPITGTLMALKKVRAKGENEMWVLVGSCNYEPPESLHTPVSRFQLTFKLSQMAFKKYPLPIGEFGSFWRLYPHILSRKWLESCYGYPCWERLHMSLNIPSGFVSCSSHKNWLKFSLHIAVPSLDCCWINIFMRWERNKTREVASVCTLTT